MGESIEFDCRECGTASAIDSTSLNFIENATGWEREDCMLCDDCLGEELQGVTIDLSIGSDHTRSDEFEQQRKERKRQREQGKIEHAKQSSVITFTERFYDDEWDEDKVAIELPSEAKHDLKQLETELYHPKFDRSRMCWTITAHDVDAAAEHLRDQGWTVDVET